MLVYPFADSSMSGASYAATDGGMTREDAEWYWQQYAAKPEDLRDKALAPYFDEELGAAPPTYVLVAEHDVLADENRELARRIAVDGQRGGAGRAPGDDPRLLAAPGALRRGGGVAVVHHRVARPHRLGV